MKRIFLLMLFVCCISWGQEKEFKFDNSGLTDFVVIEVPNRTQSELYNKFLDWLAVTYKNPKEVLKSQIQNEYVRFEGVKDGLVTGGLGATFPVKYLVEVYFKDGKYKFDVLSTEYYTPSSQYVVGGWRNYDFTNVKDHYKPNGDLKSRYKNEHETFPVFFNSLNVSIKDFLNSNTVEVKKSDW